MSHPSQQKVSILAALLVLFWIVAPVGAEDRQTVDSGIDLAEARPQPTFATAIDTLDPSADGVSAIAAASLQRQQLAMHSRAVAQEAGRSWQQADAAQAQAAPKQGGVGRWLKKHWYVPVLVGAAIIVVTADDGSDGPDDIED